MLGWEQANALESLYGVRLASVGKVRRRQPLRISSGAVEGDGGLVAFVRGERATYKIHLGSGSAMIEPGSRYLCIVPGRSTGVTDKGVPARIFLPFEGDNMLAIILSKAFLLADDLKITDPTILRQLPS